MIKVILKKDIGDFITLTNTDLLFDHTSINVPAVYESWKWLIHDIDTVKPIIITAFADMFYTDNSNNIFFLDLIEGKTHCIAKSREEFLIFMSKKENQEDYLFTFIISYMKENNIIRRQNEVFSFIKPMILGGVNEPENIEVSDISVWVHMIGQIHEKVKNLPPGTKTDNISFK